MGQESKLQHIYTQQNMYVNGFLQLFACKEKNKSLHKAARSARRSLSPKKTFSINSSRNCLKREISLKNYDPLDPSPNT